MFGRKKRNREASEQTPTEATTASAATEAAPDQDAPDPRANGPWDESEMPGERAEYLDLGALLLKPVARVDVRVELDPRDRVPRAVNMDFGGGSVQVQVFTAPKSSGLWDEVRAELVAGLRRDGGDPTVSNGPLGMQVNAQFAGVTPSGENGFRLARFVGIDGPRWFLRCVYTGDAALPGPTAEVLDDAVRGLVVVRGQDPHPPRDLLALTVPEDAEVHPAGAPTGADEDAGRTPAEPGAAVQEPRRGPEITEIG